MSLLLTLANPGVGSNPEPPPQKVRWPSSEWPALRASLSAPVYEARLRRALEAATPTTDLSALLLNSTFKPGGEGGGDGGDDGGISALWYTQPPRGSSLTLFRDLALLLGLWHEMRRGSHNGVHELWCGPTYLYLVNTLHGPNIPAKPSPYADLAPPPSQVFTTAEALHKAIKRAFKKHPGRSQTGICRDLSKPRKGCRGSCD